MHKEEKPKHKKLHSKIAHRKVFDVTRPGQSIASPNSRSVIVGHKPPVQDDQFVASAPLLRASDPSEKRALLDHASTKGIQPLAKLDVTPDTPVPDENNSALPPVAAVAAETTAATPVTSAPLLTSTQSTPSSPSASPQPKPASVEQEDHLADPESPPGAPNLPGTKPETSASSEANSPDSFITPEETPAHLAMEQMVQANDDIPIWEHPDTSEQVSATPYHTPTADERAGGHSKSIEDLLAETGAPILENEQPPSLIISHHHKHHTSWWQSMLIFIFVLLLITAILNFLLDAEIIRTGLDLPYTDLL